MLTYYESQSTQYVWWIYGNLEYADENYAREIMQLFTTGLFKLNPDGTHIIGENGDPERVYTNFDIVEYARVWTGFEARRKRGNTEGSPWINLIDPMRINMAFRDVFPKLGLENTYIGDGVPLCADLPDKHFLMKGVSYRLLGVNPTPELVDDPVDWASDPLAQRLKLQTGSGLLTKLCGSQDASSCAYDAKVVLDETIGCNGVECDVDTVRVVEVGNGIFYEYVQPPCVHQAFFDNPVMVVKRWDWQDLTCADPRTQVASASCCNSDTGEGEWMDMVSFILRNQPSLSTHESVANHTLTFLSSTGGKGLLLRPLRDGVLGPNSPDSAIDLLVHHAMTKTPPLDRIVKILDSTGPTPRAHSARRLTWAAM